MYVCLGGYVLSCARFIHVSFMVRMTLYHKPCVFVHMLSKMLGTRVPEMIQNKIICIYIVTTLFIELDFQYRKIVNMGWQN